MHMSACALAHKHSQHTHAHMHAHTHTHTHTHTHFNGDTTPQWMEAHRLFHEASIALEWDRARLKGMWAQFWASHQRFFKYLCIAAKVPQAVKITQKAIADGKVKNLCNNDYV